MAASMERKHPTAQLFAETGAGHGIEPGLTVHADRDSAVKSDTLAQLLPTLGPAELQPPAPVRRQRSQRSPVGNVEVPSRLPEPFRR
jgi:hypothetical protein